MSVIDSASFASLLNGSRGAKKIVCLPSLRSFPPATSPASGHGVLVSCSTHVVDELFPSVRNHHVIHQSWWNNYSTWMSLNRTNISQFSIFHLYRFQTSSWSFQDKGNGSQSSAADSFFSWFWNLPFNTGGGIAFRCIAPSASSFILIMVSKDIRGTLGRCEFQKNRFCISGIQEL